MSSIIHPISPIYNKEAKILILGSFPSVRSREEGFFYGHPQNRFWKVLANILYCDVPKSIEEKKAMLLGHGIAVWDVIGQCEIIGSADSSIANEKVNDISAILDESDIKAIFTNGRKAHELYMKKIQPTVGIEAIYLPSTSPANATWSLEKLTEEWTIIKEYI